MERNLTSDEIVTTVLKHCRVSHKDVATPSRVREYVYARNLAMYFLRIYTHMTEANIAILFNRDRTTVIYAVKTVNDQIKSDSLLRSDVFHINAAFSKLQLTEPNGKN